MKHKLLFGIIVIVIGSYFTLKPLFSPGFFTMHDDTQVARVSEMAISLSDGMFPVRWVNNLGYGYGYPIFNFYAPFAYYVGGIFVLIGFNALLATKLMIGLGIILSGIFMYLLAKEFWGHEGGIIASFLYLYAPYHAVNIYIRGAVAELWAYAFTPLIFYGLWGTYKTGRYRFVLFGVIGYAGVILSHNLTAMMITPFVGLVYITLLMLLWRKNEKTKILYLSILPVAGIMLSAFYWLPALMEMKYTNVSSQVGGGADFRDHFVCLSQLWNSPWGYAGSAPGCIDGLSFRIGKLHLVLSLASILAIGMIFKKNKSGAFAILLTAFSFLTAVFFMLSPSGIIWQILSPMAYLQFPWRFLAITAFTTSFLSGAIIGIILKSFPMLPDRRINGILFSGIFIIIVCFTYAKLFSPQTSRNVTSNYYTNENKIRWDTSKISSEYMPKGFKKPKNKNEVSDGKFKLLKGNASVTSQSIKTQVKEYKINALTPSIFLIPLAYFPAWEVYIKGKQVPYKVLVDGISVSLPIGNWPLKLVYKETPYEKLGNLISLGGILLLFAGIIHTRKKNLS